MFSKPLTTCILTLLISTSLGYKPQQHHSSSPDGPSMNKKPKRSIDNHFGNIDGPIKPTNKCAKVLCPQPPHCPTGKLITPKGECCPICKDKKPIKSTNTQPQLNSFENHVTQNRNIFRNDDDNRFGIGGNFNNVNNGDDNGGNKVNNVRYSNLPKDDGSRLGIQNDDIFVNNKVKYDDNNGYNNGYGNYYNDGYNNGYGYGNNGYNDDNGVYYNQAQYYGNQIPNNKIYYGNNQYYNNPYSNQQQLYYGNNQYIKQPNNYYGQGYGYGNQQQYYNNPYIQQQQYYGNGYGYGYGNNQYNTGYTTGLGYNNGYGYGNGYDDGYDDKSKKQYVTQQTYQQQQNIKPVYIRKRLLDMA